MTTVNDLIDDVERLLAETGEHLAPWQRRMLGDVYARLLEPINTEKVSTST